MNHLLRLLILLSTFLAGVADADAQCGLEIGAGNQIPVYYVAGCIGSPNVQLYLFGAGRQTFQWQYKAAASSTFADITGATNSWFPPAASGFYRTYVSGGACSGYTDSVEVKVAAASIPLTVSPASVSKCAGAAPVRLVLNGIQGRYSFAWYNGTTLVTRDTTCFAGTTGLYHCVVTDMNSGCSGTSPVVPVSFSNPPAPVAAQKQINACPGDTILLSASSTVLRGLLRWTGPNSYADTGAGIYRNGVSALDTGRYLVRVTDTLGCISGADTVSLRIFCPDSVWAGDVNRDKTVDNLDALALALAFGRTGPARVSPAILWQAQDCQPWNTTLPGYPRINSKHADCDGDGTVAFSDTLAIAANYGMTHPKSVRFPTAKVSGVPVLTADLTTAVAVAGKTLDVPVLFGSRSEPAPAMTGIAARIVIEDFTASGPPRLSFGQSWLNGPAMLAFSKVISPNVLDWAYARTDRSVASNGGLFATLSIPVPEAAAGSMLKLHFDNVRIVDSAGRVITNYQVLDDSVLVQAAAEVPQIQSTGTAFSISPNPSAGPCIIRLRLVTPDAFTIEVSDVSGRLVRSIAGEKQPGAQEFQQRLQLTDLFPGMYLIRIREASGACTLPQKWIRL